MGSKLVREKIRGIYLYARKGWSVIRQWAQGSLSLAKRVLRYKMDREEQSIPKASVGHAVCSEQADGIKHGGDGNTYIHNHPAKYLPRVRGRKKRLDNNLKK